MAEDKKRLVLVMLLSLVVLYGWDLFMRWQWPAWYAQRGKPPAQQVTNTTPPATTTTTPSTGMSTTLPGATTQAISPTGAWHARGDAGNAGMTTLGSGAHDDKGFAL